MIESAGMKYMRCLSITIFCLLIVVQSLAQALPHNAAPAIQEAACDTVQNSSSGCPCTDDHESGQCDVSCTCCAAFAALPGRVTFHTPFSTEVFFPVESPLLLPQVCLPIYVPPQNRLLVVRSDAMPKRTIINGKFLRLRVGVQASMCADRLQQPYSQGAFS